MVRYNKNVDPLKYYKPEFVVKAVHDECIIDGVLKCKVEWVGKEEQTWEPSHRIRHTGPYKDFQKSLNSQSDISSIEYKVEDIISRRFHNGVNQYLVLWKDYPIDQCTWEPEEHLTNCQEILIDFKRRLLVYYLQSFRQGIIPQTNGYHLSKPNHEK